MKITCKNCNHIYSGHYCSNCGQTSQTHRLNIHFLWHEIQHGLFHFDKGILYSLKQLFTRPGHSIRDFIDGKRIRHFKPISLVLLLATLYGFLYHYFDINLSEKGVKNEAEDIKVNEWIINHYAWATLLTIPLYTIGTTIAFRKQAYNLFEYFILNTFKASQRLTISITLFPLLYYFNGTSTMKSILFMIYLIDIGFIFWTNAQFFNKLSLKKTFFLTLLSQLIFLICLISIILGIELIMKIF